MLWFCKPAFSEIFEILLSEVYMYTSDYCCSVLSAFTFEAVEDEALKVAMQNVINQACAALRAQDALNKEIESLSAKATFCFDKKQAKSYIASISQLSQFSIITEELRFFQMGVAEL